jgi:hypothetical protein
MQVTVKILVLDWVFHCRGEGSNGVTSESNWQTKTRWQPIWRPFVGYVKTLWAMQASTLKNTEFYQHGAPIIRYNDEPICLYVCLSFWKTPPRRVTNVVFKTRPSKRNATLARSLLNKLPKLTIKVDKIDKHIKGQRCLAVRRSFIFSIPNKTTWPDYPHFCQCVMLAAPTEAGHMRYLVRPQTRCVSHLGFFKQRT